MKTLFLAATALTISGAALAQTTQGTTPQTHQGHMQTQQGHMQHNPTQQGTMQQAPTHNMAQHGTMQHQGMNHSMMDPNARLQAPTHWSAEQRAMFDQHSRNFPTSWTQQQRTAFQQQMTRPPVQWTAQERQMYEQHMANLPANWTAQQRAAYQQQVADFRQPWMQMQTGQMHHDQMQHGQMQHGQMQQGQTGQMQQGQNWQDQQMQGQQGAWATGQTGGFAQGDMREWAGMGGPYEEVYGSGQVTLQPRPATTNYPPCSPGRGDDRCIQLYEPGVRQSLSNWNQPTGGIQGGAATGMGGPLDDDEYSAVGTAHHSMAGTSANGTTEYAGMGGPLEAQDGYPPCAPGPGDDRCIQLYERGVTGRD